MMPLCIYLIEAEGQRILHTGDYRDHGFIGKGLLNTIKYHINKQGSIDFLITEGTMLSRLNEKVKHENELMKDVIQIMKQYKNVFVMCSSTDMERLATFHAANENILRRPFVCDDFQKSVLNIFTETAGKESSLFDFSGSYSFRIDDTKLLSWLNDVISKMPHYIQEKKNLEELLPSVWAGRGIYKQVEKVQLIPIFSGKSIGKK